MRTVNAAAAVAAWRGDAPTARDRLAELEAAGEVHDEAWWARFTGEAA